VYFVYVLVCLRQVFLFRSLFPRLYVTKQHSSAFSQLSLSETSHWCVVLNVHLSLSHDKKKMCMVCAAWWQCLDKNEAESCQWIFSFKHQTSSHIVEVFRRIRLIRQKPCPCLIHLLCDFHHYFTFPLFFPWNPVFAHNCVVGCALAV